MHGWPHCDGTVLLGSCKRQWTHSTGRCLCLFSRHIQLMHNGDHNRDIVCLVISDKDLKILFCSFCLALTQNQVGLWDTHAACIYVYIPNFEETSHDCYKTGDHPKLILLNFLSNWKQHGRSMENSQLISFGSLGDNSYITEQSNNYQATPIPNTSNYVLLT